MFKPGYFFPLFFVLAFHFSSVYVVASNPWSLIEEEEIGVEDLNRQIIPETYLTLRVDLDSLRGRLAQAPLQYSEEAVKKQILLPIPMPNGKMELFQLMEAPIMHPELAAKYPMLKSYVGVGVDDPTAFLRCDMTQFGFHAMVLSGRHQGAFIDPYAKNDTQHYISYYQKDYHKSNLSACHFVDHPSESESIDLSILKNIQGDCKLRTYRLALACTGEYANFHGGNVPDVMAAFHTTMTRVNGIFERDVAIRLEMIANTDELIFLDPSADPYLFEYPVENQAVCDGIIGTENYDIGHVFGVGNGGAAERSSCCVEGLKAEGYSTILSPVGDGFDINFVSHEFGHQFGCSHTANGNCNNTPATSVEPGNAYSVMGFDFFCDPIIEEVRGAYFHAVNILEMALNIAEGPPGSCATVTDTGNNPPTVEGGQDHFFLPISTPFKLTAEGFDEDGDVLTYNWEQMDNEERTDPPVSTNDAGPAFRSYEPVEAAHRYFPALEYLVNGTDYLWEVLPSVSRVMNFRVTVRDNFIGGGCTSEDDVDLTFTESAGPFVVQHPNTNETWLQGANYAVAWDVANTEKTPVACSQVDILLSLDGGFTYPVVLAAGVPNDGSELVEAPAVEASTARVMVKCSDNIFFDISDEDFSIGLATEPTLVMAIDPPISEICGISEEGIYTITFSALAGFEEEITLSANGLPSGATLEFSQNPVDPAQAVNLTLKDLDLVAPGNYAISINGTSPSTTVEEVIEVVVSNELATAISLVAPANGAQINTLRPSFAWTNGLPNGEAYIIEIATNPAFGPTVVATSTAAGQNFTLENDLEPLAVYYWRIIPIQACGENVENLPFYSFQINGAVCKTFTNSEPAFIPGFLYTTTSTLTVEEDFTLTSATLSMELFHKFIGDLSATLTAPTGTSVELFNRPGYPAIPVGCDEDDLLVTFDDSASNSAMDFENTCQFAGEYAIEGSFQPISPFAALSGQNTLGDWELTITDEKFSHAGSVDRWSLDLCLEKNAGALPEFSKTDLFVPDLGSEVVSNENLSTTSTTATADQITYTITALPMAGNLLLNGLNPGIGTSFTQADLDNNLLVYINTNPDVLVDEFRFDIQTFDGQWIPNEFLTINIGEMSNTNTALGPLSFEVFPNPAGDIITIRSKQIANLPLKVAIYNVMGQLLKEIELDVNQAILDEKIDVSAFPAGSYWVLLSGGSMYGRQVFMKQ